MSDGFILKVNAKFIRFVNCVFVLRNLRDFDAPNVVKSAFTVYQKRIVRDDVWNVFSSHRKK